MDINYSIIIPHHNIPSLLRRLLLTIPIRSDVQIIVIDDCSTCNLEELDEIRREFYWVEWYNTGTNGGGGKARNIGLKHAKGKYLIFADSDDFFNLCFNQSLNKYINSNYDIIYFNCNAIDSETYGTIYNRGNHIGSIIKHSIAQNNYNLIKYRLTQPWAKFINRNLVLQNSIQFEESVISNDVHFSTQVDFRAINIHIDPHAIYCTTYRNSSVSHLLSPERALIRLRIDGHKWVFMKNNMKNTPPLRYLIGEALFAIFQDGNITQKSEAYRICKSFGLNKFSTKKMVSKIYTIKKTKKILLSIIPTFIKSLIIESR